MNPKPQIALWKTAALSISITGLLLAILVFALQLIQNKAGSKSEISSTHIRSYSYPNDFDKALNHYYTYLLDSSGTKTIKQIIDSQKRGLFKSWNSSNTNFNLGMQCIDVWFYITVQNKSERDICLVWQLENAIDSAQLFSETPSGFDKHLPVSFYTPLAERPLPIKALFDTIWLHPNEVRELYFHVFKNHYNTNVPMTLLPLSLFQSHENRNNSIYSGYISVFIFIIFFNLFLYISLRDPIHLWYSLFIFSISMMLIIDDYFPILIFPKFISQILLITEPLPFVDWGMVGSGMVMQILLRQNQQNSYFWLPFRLLLSIGFLIGSLQLGFCAFSLSHQCTYPFYFFHSLSNLFVLLSSFIGICGVVEKIIQQEFLAKIYFCTCMLPVLGILNSYLNCIGFTNFSFMFPSSVAVGIMIEIIVLTILLTRRYNRLQYEKNELLKQQLMIQEDLSYKIAEAQENEQKRIAEDIHDGVGSILVAIRMMVNKNIHYFNNIGQAETVSVLSKIEHQIDRLLIDMRNIAHNLMPKDFEFEEFAEIIKNHLAMLSSSSTINVEYYLDPEINNLPKNIQINLFRIFTELLTNAIKHSKTKDITIQFISHDTNVTLIIEDEGIGFQVEEKNNGIGLKNIYSRITFLHGKISFDSSSKGTIIVVEIPLC